MKSINLVTSDDRSNLLVTTKIRAGVYRIIDRMDNRYDIERTGENFDGNQWHLFRDTGGYEREYWNTFVTKSDAMDAIIRQYRTLLSEQEAHEAESAKIAPKKVILKVCEHCGIEYEAERNSSRFHSTQCRVAYNRQLKKKAKHIEPIYDALYKICGKLGNDKRDKHHEAVLELINIKKYIDMHLYWIARWWQCETCKQSVMVFCPDDEHCQCGKAAKWFIMNTRS